jgi:hypothetical protein
MPAKNPDLPLSPRPSRRRPLAAVLAVALALGAGAAQARPREASAAAKGLFASIQEYVVSLFVSRLAAPLGLPTAIGSADTTTTSPTSSGTSTTGSSTKPGSTDTAGSRLDPNG